MAAGEMILIRGDIESARLCLEEYKKTKLKSLKGLSAYHVQQAAEKLIKIQIYNSGKKYNNKNVYTHNIGDLIDYARAIGAELIVPSAIEKDALRITSWEAKGRYDLHMTVRVDRVASTWNIVDGWYHQMRDLGYR